MRASLIPDAEPVRYTDLIERCDQLMAAAQAMIDRIDQLLPAQKDEHHVERPDNPR